MDSAKIIADQDSGTVKYVKETILKEMSFSEWIDNIQRGTFETPLLPYGTIMVKRIEQRTMYFVQIPEARMLCGYGTTPPHMYDLALPWRVVAFHMQGGVIVNVYIRFAKGAIMSDDDPLFYPAFPNQDSSGKICAGTVLNASMQKDTAPAIIAAAIVGLNESGYNDDLSSHIEKNLPPQIKAIPGNEHTDFKAVGSVFKAWEKWTIQAGVDWRSVNDLSWRYAESFGTFSSRLSP